MLTRRAFVAALPLFHVALFSMAPAGTEEPPPRRVTYRVDGRMVFGLYPFHFEGGIDEEIDRVAGRYRLTAAGAGSQISNRLESVGVIRGGRFLPTTTDIALNLWGHQSRTTIIYDLDQGRIAYSHLGHSFFFGARRELHAILHPQAAQGVDDVVTAALNYADGALRADRTGAFRIYLVARMPRESPQPEDGESAADRAEIVPFVFRVVRDSLEGGGLAELDLSQFSSWARRGHPAQIVFGRNRLPNSIQGDLSLGTSVRIGFQFDERAVPVYPRPSSVFPPEVAPSG